MKIKQIVDRLKNFDYYHPFEFKGCTDEEIRALEQLLPSNYTLPTAYKEMLSEIGHRAAHYNSGATFYYNHIFDATKSNFIERWSDRFKADFHGDLDLSDAFIVSYNTSIYFTFVKLSEGDDPPAYFYKVEDHACYKSKYPISIVLESGLESFIERQKELHQDFPKTFQPVKRFKYTVSKVINWTLDALDNNPSSAQLEKINYLKRKIVNAFYLELGTGSTSRTYSDLAIKEEDIKYFRDLNPINSQLVEKHLCDAKDFIESRVPSLGKAKSYDRPAFSAPPDLLSDIHQTLVNRNIIFKGLSKSELEKHLKQFGNRTFPKAYIEFLELFGKEIQGFDDKYKLLYPLSELFDYESYLENVLQAQIEEEYIPSSYYPKMIVFARKGEKIAFFILNDEGDDPPVYRYEYYEDYTEECVQESPHFSTYLMKILTKGMQ